MGESEPVGAPRTRRPNINTSQASVAVTSSTMSSARTLQSPGSAKLPLMPQIRAKTALIRMKEAAPRRCDLLRRGAVREGEAIAWQRTPAELRTLTHVCATVQAAEDVLLAAQDDGELLGVLRVSSFRSATTHLLPSVLTAFKRQHPGVMKLLDMDQAGIGSFPTAFASQKGHLLSAH